MLESNAFLNPCRSIRFLFNLKHWTLFELLEKNLRGYVKMFNSFIIIIQKALNHLICYFFIL